MTAKDDPGRPAWAIWLGLLGVVAVLLAAAFLLNRRFRSSVGIQGAPIASVTAPATVSAPSSQVASSSPLSSAARSPGSIAAAANPASTAALPSSAHVANSPLEKEIVAAYLHYWDVLTQAYLNLDPSVLPQVLGNPKLGREQAEIAQYKADGHAAKLIVDHHIALVQVSADHAVVYDEYLNRSVFVDPTTKRELPTSSAPPHVEKHSYDMQKINGVWKVVDGARHD